MPLTNSCVLSRCNVKLLLSILVIGGSCKSNPVLLVAGVIPCRPHTVHGQCNTAAVLAGTIHCEIGRRLIPEPSAGQGISPVTPMARR
ncbi:hypothetical protein CY34DRAFT_209263 [Suillus luteus UH-Slu-Lm8-n1]|uniref:Secreted protein n=1 Tax=Suillus luteus UH-Slu-Lm8-n1 TaxID=930992 RepID=A0A0D0BPC7_9AGAM|nr:hypothetical protein CY34DRAFT_209263 [Suillus luteus UH-Slu-Lm8-n1]